MKPALFYEKISEGRVRCTLCPRYCRLKPNQHGFCFVRKNINGELYSLAYGKPYAVNVDPVEKKPLFHFLPGSQILSIGTAGCNMACKFCQNWDISKASFDQKRALDFSPDRLIQLAYHYHAGSIAYTYNEPTIFAEYAMDTAFLARQHQLRNVMVTNGYITPEAIFKVYENMDAANVDLKSIRENFYQDLTLSRLQPVLECLKILKSMGIWVEITNLVIPGKNEDLKEIRELCEWVLRELGPDVPVHFTAFHPAYRLSDVMPTRASMLLKARKIAIEIGLNYVYVGNIMDEKSSTTYCKNCGTVIIRRTWHSSKTPLLENGSCKKCGQKIPGVFN